MMQLLIPNVQEDILTIGIKNQKDRLDELIQGLETRSMTSEALNEGLRTVERNLKHLRQVA